MDDMKKKIVSQLVRKEGQDQENSTPGSEIRAVKNGCGSCELLILNEVTLLFSNPYT